MPQKITPYKKKTPRLTANIGILIANNRRTDLMERFMAMMDFCCQQIPQVIAVNEFSIKEIIFCMEELEKNQTVPEAKIAEWKNHLHKVSPGRSYTKFVYDLATRGLFAVLLHEGYQGKYKDVWQKALARSAIPTMISRK